jgi:hypothetical protein
MPGRSAESMRNLRASEARDVMPHEFSLVVTYCRKRIFYTARVDFTNAMHAFLLPSLCLSYS